MRKITSSFTTLGLMAGFSLSSAGALAAGQSNPVDRVSNKNALEYADVEVRPDEMNPPFVRRGLVVDPQRLTQIRAGLSEAEVRSALGDPLSNGRSRAREWDYDIKLKMPRSQNYLICQYKVVFDAQRAVSATVWRRRQCEQLAQSQPAS